MDFTRDSIQSMDAKATISPARAAAVILPTRWTASPEQVLHANLLSIFRLGDPAGIMETIWHRMPVVYEEHGASTGLDAVVRAAERFRMAIGSASCRPVGPVIGQSGLYMLRWQALQAGAYVASGCHLANIRDGRIDSLYSVID